MVLIQLRFCRKQSIRTDDYGLISFQFMIPLSVKGMRNQAAGGAGAGGDGATAFVEFKVRSSFSFRNAKSL